MGVLLIHAINPYGFKYQRRVSENNVDMDRNFRSSKDLFAQEDEEYANIYHFLNPQRKVPTGYFSNSLFFLFLKASYMITKYSMRALRQATVQGKYEFSRGIFYGENDFEPQKE